MGKSIAKEGTFADGVMLTILGTGYLYREGNSVTIEGLSRAERSAARYLLFQLQDGHFDLVEVLAGGQAGARGVHQVLRRYREMRC